jgi:hypothetical protein
MSSPEEQKAEQRRSKKAHRLQYVCEGGLEDAFDKIGYTVTGLSIRTNPDDYLITVRAFRNGELKVAFCGASTLANCLIKLRTEAQHGRLRWRADKYWKQ